MKNSKTGIMIMQTVDRTAEQISCKLQCKQYVSDIPQMMKNNKKKGQDLL